MRGFIILILLILATISLPLLASSTSVMARKALVGGWSPIGNVNDAHIQEIAEFAVAEHNKEANSKLTLSKVVRGETQTVAGVNYRLVVAVQDGGAAAYYEAVVWEKIWMKFRKLTSFDLVKGR